MFPEPLGPMRKTIYRSSLKVTLLMPRARQCTPWLRSDESSVLLQFLLDIGDDVFRVLDAVLRRMKHGIRLRALAAVLCA